MTTPHITALKLAKQWFDQHRLPERPEDVTAEQVIKAIEIALAEANAQQETYITADEARELGAGNAEVQTIFGDWVLCQVGCAYAARWRDEPLKYRAIKPEPQQAAYPQPPKKVEPLKQISWKDLPVGVAVQDKEIKVIWFYAAQLTDSALLVTPEKNAFRTTTYSDLELAPADRQPWIAFQSDYKLPTSLEFKIHSSGEKYRITGIAKGWELK